MCQGDPSATFEVMLGWAMVAMPWAMPSRCLQIWWSRCFANLGGKHEFLKAFHLITQYDAVYVSVSGENYSVLLGGCIDVIQSPDGAHVLTQTLQRSHLERPVTDSN